MKNLKTTLLLILIGIFAAATNNIMAQGEWNPDGTPVDQKQVAPAAEEEMLKVDAIEGEKAPGIKDDLGPPKTKQLTNTSSEILDVGKLNIDDLNAINADVESGAISKGEINDMLSIGEISHALMVEQGLDSQSALFIIAKAHEKEKEKE